MNATRSDGRAQFPPAQASVCDDPRQRVTSPSGIDLLELSRLAGLPLAAVLRCMSAGVLSHDTGDSGDPPRYHAGDLQALMRVRFLCEHGMSLDAASSATRDGSLSIDEMLRE